MVALRHRSRWKTEARNNSTISLFSGPPLKFVTAIDVNLESMIDQVITGWATLNKTGFYPRYAEVTKGKQTLSSAARLGNNRTFLELRRFIPPVNYLNYVSLTVQEPLGKMVYDTWGPSQPNWVVIDGNVLAILQSRLNGGLPTPIVATPSIPSTNDLYKVAKSKILNQVGRPDYSFGEPLGEILNTYRLIKAPFKTVTRLIKSFGKKVEKAHKLSHKRRAIYAASVYAEAKWGIRPLLKVVDDACAATADRLYKKQVHRIQRYSRTEEATGINIGRTSASRNFLTTVNSHTYYVQKSIRVTREVNVGIRFYYADTGGLSTLLGLRAQDIPGVVWELMPFSFLIDRVYNVKQFLNGSANFLSGTTKYIGGWESSRVKTETTLVVTNIHQSTSVNLRPSPSRTNPQITTDFSYGRDKWEPQLADARPPALAGKLVSSLSSTADLAAATLLNLDAIGSYFGPTRR